MANAIPRRIDRGDLRRSDDLDGRPSRYASPSRRQAEFKVGGGRHDEKFAYKKRSAAYIEKLLKKTAWLDEWRAQKGIVGNPTISRHRNP